MLSCIFDLSLGRDILTGLFMCLCYSPKTPFGQSTSDRKFRRRFISFWFFAKKGKFFVSGRWSFVSLEVFFCLERKKNVFCFRFEKKYLNLLFWSADIQMTARKWLLAEWRGPRHLSLQSLLEVPGSRPSLELFLWQKNLTPLCQSCRKLVLNSELPQLS